MSQSALVQPTISRALLCMGSGDDAMSAPPAMNVVNGQPLIYHQAKQLQRLGISDLTIAVETVPPELPMLVERMRGEGMQVQLIRNIAEMTPLPDYKSAVLVRSTDMWVGDGLLQEMASARPNTIAIVEEHPENKGFERIDLARRWSGLAVLDGSILNRAADIAEGWSLDSCLLRHALQAGAKEIALKQDVVVTGALRKFDDSSRVVDLGASLMAGDTVGGLIEGFAALAGRTLLPSIWANPWVRSLVEWGFPGLAVVATAVGFAGYATAALAVGVAALFAAAVREQLRQAEYRGGHKDLVAATSMALLTMSLAAALFASGATVFDATIFALALAGLVNIARAGFPEKWLREFSPLLAALALFAASIAGTLVPAAKLAMLVIVCGQVVAHLRRRSRTELNAN